MAKQIKIVEVPAYYHGMRGLLLNQHNKGILDVQELLNDPYAALLSVTSCNVAPDGDVTHFYHFSIKQNGSN